MTVPAAIVSESLRNAIRLKSFELLKVSMQIGRLVSISISAAHDLGKCLCDDVSKPYILHEYTFTLGSFLRFVQ
jgi:hypothetical protein